MPRQINNHSRAGFTLLEVLVVLLIIGMTAAIVVPRLPALAASLEFALQRQTFEQTIGGLAYQAFRKSDDLVLAGSYTDRGHVVERDERRRSIANGISPLPGIRPLQASARDPLPPLNPLTAELTLPEGWRVEISEPIYFRSSGYCTGGHVELIVGERRYVYRLDAPLCEASLIP